MLGAPLKFGGSAAIGAVEKCAAARRTADRSRISRGRRAAAKTARLPRLQNDRGHRRHQRGSARGASRLRAVEKCTRDRAAVLALSRYSVLKNGPCSWPDNLGRAASQLVSLTQSWLSAPPLLFLSSHHAPRARAISARKGCGRWARSDVFVRPPAAPLHAAANAHGAVLRLGSRDCLTRAQRALATRTASASLAARTAAVEEFRSSSTASTWSLPPRQSADIRIGTSDRCAKIPVMRGNAWGSAIATIRNACLTPQVALPMRSDARRFHRRPRRARCRAAKLLRAPR